MKDVTPADHQARQGERWRGTNDGWFRTKGGAPALPMEPSRQARVETIEGARPFGELSWTTASSIETICFRR
jgi:hypothetical protein